MDVGHLLDSLGDGILSVDAEGRVVLLNDAAGSLLGLAPPEAGQPWYPGLGAFQADRTTPMDEQDFPLLAAARLGIRVEKDVFLLPEDAPTGRLVRVNAWPVKGRNGAPDGAVAVVRPAEHCRETEHHRQGMLVQLLRAVAATANEATGLDAALTVALTLVARAENWSVGQAYVVCEFPPMFVQLKARFISEPERYESFCIGTGELRMGLHEGLPGRVYDTGKPVFVSDATTDPGLPRRWTAAAVGLHAGFAFPILVRDEVVGVLEFGAPEHAAPDPGLLEVLVQVGTLLGRVVERERAKVREAFFRAIIDHVGGPIFVKDRSLRWVLLNRAHEEWIGFPREEMIGKTDHDYFPPEQAEFFQQKDRELFASGSTVSIQEEPITDSAGQVHWLTTTKVPLRGPHGEITHLVGIIHDITRLKNAEEDLRQRNLQLAAEVRQHAAAEAQLRSVNRDLEGFCHSVSHDLRTPLRAIDGFSSLLLREHADELDEVGRHCLSRVRANAQWMAHLMDDLLQLSRVSRMPLHRQRIDLRALADQVMEQLREAEPERRVTFTAPASLFVEADPRLVHLLLENLLGNAWKFTSLRPEAQITLRQSGDTFCVEDDGAGFEMEYVDALFKPFSRLHGQEQFPGAGVGLATVQRIVELHGGRVWAEGVVGEGAKVSFTLAT